MSGTVRQNSASRRATKRIQGDGVRFDDATKLSMKPPSAPNSVPR